MRVSDDVAGAQADGVLGACLLAVQLPRLGEGDRFDVVLNSDLLSWEGARVHRGGWTRLSVPHIFWGNYPTYPQAIEQDTTLVEFAVAAPPLRHGVNIVEIHLCAGGSGGSIVVERVEITITYREED